MMLHLPVFPNEARKEQMRVATDRAAFTGVLLLGPFLVLRVVDNGRDSQVSLGGFVLGAIAALVPGIFLLIWVRARISGRKSWWAIGTLAWAGSFALALSGYWLS